MAKQETVLIVLDSPVGSYRIGRYLFMPDSPVPVPKRDAGILLNRELGNRPLKIWTEPQPKKKSTGKKPNVQLSYGDTEGGAE